MTFRELTVADLMELLADQPGHYPVTVVVNGMAGVITGVWCQPLDAQGQDAPHVLIGEHMPADPIVPTDWTGSAA